MLQIAPGWQLELERGPDWLFVRIRRPDTEADDSPPLADRIWWLLEEHFTRRLVLELDELDVLCSYLIGQLVLLHKRIAVGGGMLRLCGLSENNRQVLRFCGNGTGGPQAAALSGEGNRHQCGSPPGGLSFSIGLGARARYVSFCPAVAYR